ncbi:spermatogenesis-associated protein 22 isoform X1 [Peromyscus maniculatus bairdii]|uniref:Spermatogenesis associated 22 n=1 Tax=Peromyscus maniculatus bairdii TaxID=230844 RepID=A0A6J0CFB2_PERMB|nr:spermatogenesis-associated protein 22 [Peromyscus maniculatus bairdii]XP_042138296.1 spermatogenesis-associated protein 22 [Peromyscus maniculatus bairdii]XP_042138297.1 spermatogenesis-associated protein 22 [Peromyscus maniculatus bairdii]
MKRNLNESSTRSTAGCLPVPLFNQKKRNRQPLTSNPLQNDPGISTVSDSYGSPPLPTDWAWEAVNPEVTPLKKTMNTRQIPASASYPLKSQDSVSKSIQSNAEGSQSGWGYRGDNRNTSLRTWDKNDFRPQCKTASPAANSEFSSYAVNLGAQRQKQSGTPEFSDFHGNRETEVLRQTCFSKVPGSTVKGPDRASALQAFKPRFQQNQFKKTVLGDTPGENTLKEAPLRQLKEKDNSLRIISAVIESMRYWRAQVQKTVLLFEILAVLDSAVTPGPHYSKTFLMRDGKNTLPCVFYEIDRELPRLIRGRVHRCVGHYDPDKNIFKCVSVRPASASEQKTFQAFVTIADAEMKYHTKIMNEM